jgi:proteasome alpha subunit
LRPRRAFRRLAGQLLERLVAPDDPTIDVPHTDERRPGIHDTLTGEDDPGHGPDGAPEGAPDGPETIEQ